MLTFKKVQPFVDLFESAADSSAKIKCLTSFVEKRLFLRYNLRYSFFDYETDDFVHCLLNVCHTYDLEDVGKLVSETFSVKREAFTLKRLDVILAVGLYNDAQQLLDKKAKLLQVPGQNRYAEDRIVPCVARLRKMPMFPPADIAALVESVPITPDKEKMMKPMFIYQSIKLATHFSIDKERAHAFQVLLRQGVSRGVAIATNCLTCGFLS